MNRIALLVNLIGGFVCVLGVVAWGVMTDWERSADGSAEMRARLGIVPFCITEPRLYRPFTGADMEGPYTFHDRDGAPTYHKFVFRRGDRIIGFVDVDAWCVTLGPERFGSYYEDPNDLSDCPLRFPDPPTAEEAIERAQEVLSQYPGADVETPFLFGRGGPEWWLIRVRRGHEVIAWVTVSTWDGHVWELPSGYWDNPTSGW